MLEKHLLKIWKAYPMDRLEAMSVIVAVTETGSFSAASRRLNTPVATVSRTVAELEARYEGPTISAILAPDEADRCRDDPTSKPASALSGR